MADLHEAGAQILQHAAEGFGREPLREMMLLHDGVYLAQPLRARFARKVELPSGSTSEPDEKKYFNSVLPAMEARDPYCSVDASACSEGFWAPPPAAAPAQAAPPGAPRSRRLRGEGLALLGSHDRHARLKRIESAGLRDIRRLMRKLGVDLLALLDGKLAFRDERAHQIRGLLARDSHSPHASQKDVLETIADRCHVGLPSSRLSHIRQALTYL